MKVTSSEHTCWNIIAAACKIALVTATDMTHRLASNVCTPCGEPCNVMARGGPRRTARAERSESFISIDSASVDHLTRALEAYPDQKVTRWVTCTRRAPTHRSARARAPTFFKRDTAGHTAGRFNSLQPDLLYTLQLGCADCDISVTPLCYSIFFTSYHYSTAVHVHVHVVRS